MTQQPERPDSGTAGSPDPNPPGWGQPEQRAHGEPQPGYGQPQGYEQAQGYEQPQGYGSPQQPYRSSYPQVPGVPASGYTVRDPRLAEPWRRFVGWIVDWIVISIITSVVWIPAAVRSSTNQGAGAYFVTGVFGLCLAVLYYWLLTGFWGTTIGKRLVGAWVVTAAGASKVGLGAAFIRAIVFDVIPAIPVIGWVWFLLDNLWLLWDQRRQCLHDKAAGTIVVKGAALGR